MPIQDRPLRTPWSTRVTVPSISARCHFCSSGTSWPGRSGGRRQRRPSQHRHLQRTVANKELGAIIGLDPEPVFSVPGRLNITGKHHSCIGVLECALEYQSSSPHRFSKPATAKNPAARPNPPRNHGSPNPAPSDWIHRTDRLPVEKGPHPAPAAGTCPAPSNPPPKQNPEGR